MIDQLPAGLLARFDAEQRAEVQLAVERVVAAYSEQYRRERRAFDEAEGDDGITYAWNLRQHGLARVIEYLQDVLVADVRVNGLTHAIHVGSLVIRPYRLGPHAPADIHLERLDPNSYVKTFVGLDNAAKAQLTLDLKGATAARPADPAAIYAPDQLVLASYGNPVTGRSAIFLGAPLDQLHEGSYWRWVEQLADQDELRDEDDNPARPLAGPPTPPPYDAGAEPDLPIAPRIGSDRRQRR